MKVIVIHSLAYQGLGGSFEELTYIKSFRDTADGRGHTEVTNDVQEALKFPDASSAMQFWRQQSKSVPIRPDGKPNRPLTAFNVEIRDEDNTSPPIK